MLKPSVTQKRMLLLQESDVGSTVIINRLVIILQYTYITLYLIPISGQIADSVTVLVLARPGYLEGPFVAEYRFYDENRG